MVPKPLSNSKATSFYATSNFLVIEKKVENFEIFEKMLRVGKVKEQLSKRKKKLILGGDFINQNS